MSFYRTAWDLLFWNFRKAVFRHRGARGPAPCQHGSDSGQAFETACAASLAWKNPAAFRKICPLLVVTPQGLRCSVAAAHVRPFWRPVFAFYGQTALALYLSALLLAFSLVKSVGYPVSAVDLAWPGFWPNIARARGTFLVEKARRALAAGDVRRALIYLHNAQGADAQNYSVGLDLALLYRAALPAASNAQFERLLVTHPQRRSETALHWLDALIVQAEFKTIFALAADQLKTDPAAGNTWAKALVFAARQSHATAGLEALLADSSRTLDPWRETLRLEIALEENRSSVGEVLLRQPWPTAAPAYAKFHRLQALARISGPLPALDALQQHEGNLDSATKLILGLALLSELKVDARLATQVNLLLARPPNADTLKMLCAHAIREGDAETFRRAYAAAVAQADLDADASLWFSLLAAAAAARDDAAVAEIGGRLGRRSETRAIALSIVSFCNGESDHTSFQYFLPWLSLPLEVNYALLEKPPIPTRRSEKLR